MNPIGLTRAEEEQETPTAPTQQPAPKGAVRCQITVPPEGKACGATAVGRIVWNKDDPKTPACADCAQRMDAQARTFGDNIRFEPLIDAKT